ncbi:MAG: endonuclease/exonuclease/phosphatase family protein [Candidatus Cryptobacteroides sp.]
MKLKHIIIMAAALLAGVQCAGARKSEIKLMSYNIRFITPDDQGVYSWESRKEPNIKMLRDVSPDVVGFQETMNGISEYLIENLPDYDCFLRYRDGEPDKHGRNQMIMWKRDRFDLLDSGRFWLSPTPDKVSKSWDANHVRHTIYVKLRDKASGREFWYFDTHLDHKSKTAKQEGVKLNVEMMKKIAGDDAVVFISGDMNIQRAKSNGYYLDPYYEWMDSAVEVAPRTCTRPTFNGFEYEGKNPGRLDHIFFRNAKAMKFDVIDSEGYGVKYISDHYPITCVFKF